MFFISGDAGNFSGNSGNAPEYYLNTEPPGLRWYEAGSSFVLSTAQPLYVAPTARRKNQEYNQGVSSGEEPNRPAPRSILCRRLGVQKAKQPLLPAPLYALGFARFFQGDFASAAYLLIPQLEASLRHILKARGADPTKRRDDATEEDRSLDAIIANHRSELLEMMGEPLLDELNRIFNLQPGPTLRHDVAHGQLSEGQCYSADVIYACWLLYRVCCLPLLTRWDEFVRPGLAIEEPGR